MGKLKKSKKQNINQKPLKDASLTANTLYEETKATDTVITWVIRNYSELKECVNYEIGDKKCTRNWNLSLLRKSFKLFIFVVTDALVNNCVIFLLRNDGKVLDSTLGNDGSNVFLAELDERQISSPQKSLMDDVLIIQCIYTTRPYENDILLAPGLQNCNTELEAISDVDMLLNDLKSLYLTGQFSDLTLRVGRKKFKVHKLILRRQSKYVNRRLIEDPNWSGEDFIINTPPAMMNEVLLYIYSGEMRNLHLDGMCEVYHIASTLEIASLQTICVHYFQSMFSVHYAVDFLELAINHKHTDFQKVIMDFLNKQPESVRQMKVWADVIRQASNLMEDEKKNQTCRSI